MIWVAVGLCLLISFIFSGIEAGILSVNRIRLKHHVKQRDRAALKLNRLLENPERLLVTVVVVTNLMNILAVALVTEELAARIGTYGYLVSLGVFLPVYLIGLELLPKSLFRRFPYRALAALAEPLRIADLLLAPMHLVGGTISRLLSEKRPVERKKLFVAREEFKYLTIESERTGTITPAEREMIHSVVDFRGITAREVMVPMTEVRTVASNSAVSELIERSRKLNIDRWPVVSESQEIVGLVTLFDIALEGRRKGPVEAVQRRIVQVAPNEPAYSVLRKLRAARATMAAVGAPGSQSLGVVTWEDLVKRLVSTASDKGGVKAGGSSESMKYEV